MKYSNQIKKFTRLFKFVLLSSAVLTRTAGGAPDPQAALEHELAWMAVRDGLSGTSEIGLVPDRARRLVADGFGEGFEARVRESYRTVAVDAVTHLDAIWMDRLAEAGASADVVDGFLAARSSALPEVIDLELADAGSDTGAKWDVYERVFKFAQYE
jgi:hypothetical protein